MKPEEGKLLYWFRQLSANTLPCSMPRQNERAREREKKKKEGRGEKNTKIPEIHHFLAKKKRRNKRKRQ